MSGIYVLVKSSNYALLRIGTAGLYSLFNHGTPALVVKQCLISLFSSRMITQKMARYARLFHTI